MSRRIVVQVNKISARHLLLIDFSLRCTPSFNGNVVELYIQTRFRFRFNWCFLVDVTLYQGPQKLVKYNEAESPLNWQFSYKSLILSQASEVGICDRSGRTVCPFGTATLFHTMKNVRRSEERNYLVIYKQDSVRHFLLEWPEVQCSPLMKRPL